MSNQSRNHAAELERFFEALTGFGRCYRARIAEWSQTSQTNRSELGALALLHREGPLRLGAIADRLSVVPSVTSRQIASLSDQGLVERIADPDDGRAGLVTITDLGRTRMRELYAQMCDHLAVHVRGWDAEHLTAAAEVLSELANTFGTPTCAYPAEPTMTPKSDKV